MRNKSGFWKKTLVLLVILLATMLAAGCSSGDEQGNDTGNDMHSGQKSKTTIVLGDFNWDSALVNNRIAQFIIENGYGYQTDVIPGETIPLMQGLSNGDVDVAMEIWVQNAQEAYDRGIADGSFVDLGTNFNDNVQGFFVPTYVIEGDPDRGIEPMAPDLKTIDDLPKYRELFVDPEDKSKGRIYGGVPGWEADKILTDKIENYGLDQYYNMFRPGSGTALTASLVGAYEAGEPWLGYYWTPTWVFGKYDLTLIEETPYDEQLWNDGYRCAFPSVDVNVVVNSDLVETAPDVVEFLENYSLSSAQISEVLAYMQDNDLEADEAALWFLAEKEDVWTGWVPEEVAEKVKQKL